LDLRSSGRLAGSYKGEGLHTLRRELSASTRGRISASPAFAAAATSPRS